MPKCRKSWREHERKKWPETKKPVKLRVGSEIGTHDHTNHPKYLNKCSTSREIMRERAREKCGQFNYLSDIWVCDSLCVAHRQFGTIKSSSFFNIVWYASRFDRNLIFLMCKYIPNWNRSQNVCLPFALSLCFSHSPFGLLFLLHIQLTKTDR